MKPKPVEETQSSKITAALVSVGGSPAPVLHVLRQHRPSHVWYFCSAATRANAIICLIHQADYLLDQQLTALEQAFIEEGGYSEQLATARLARRQSRRDQSDRADPIPRCPQCGKPMALRTAKTGSHAGRQFWGCTAYPDCKGTVEL
jgi:four helix bundle suffix protein